MSTRSTPPRSYVSAELTLHSNQMKKIIIFISNCLPWYLTMSGSVDVRDIMQALVEEPIRDPRERRDWASQLESIHAGRSAALSYSY